MRGRKPKPTKLKELNGNAGKRPLNKNEPEFTTFDENTPPPDILNEEGQLKWRELLKELIPTGVLCQTDLETLVNYCIAYQNRNDAMRAIEKYGDIIQDENGKLSRNPAFVTLNEAKKQMAQSGSLLGLDPSSRQRLIGKTDTLLHNPFAELLQ